MKILNDQFYTSPEIAKKCISLIEDIDKYDTIIEPSAGNGSFSKNFKKCFSYDLEPKGPKIIKQDFLLLNRDKNWGKNILFVGNPPFGSRSTLAKRFIKHSQELGATTIAFILPDVFSKTTNQKYNLWPKEWRLINTFKLPLNSFKISLNNKIQSYHVPCTFYVWTKLPGSVNNRVWPPKNKPKYFKFLTRGDKKADFVFNGNSGRIKNLNDVTNPKSEHYIYVENKEKVNWVKKILSSLKFPKMSSVNGGNFWINQDDILIAWNKRFNTK